MKKACLVHFLLLLCYWQLNAQTPEIKWSRQITGGDFPPTAAAIYDIQPAKGGGVIVVGADSLSLPKGDSAFFNKTYGDRIWIAKLDSAANKVWNNIYYWSHSALTSVITTNYGYAAAGHIYDQATQKSQLYLLRLNNDGSLIDQQTFGSTGEERAYGICWTPSEDLLIAGFTNSSNADIWDNHSSDGKADGWIIRIDSTEELILRHCYGGTGDDTAFSVTTHPSGFLVAGCSNSSDGDIPGNLGGFDGWVMAINYIGQVNWSKNIGGSGDDKVYKVLLNPDGTYLLIGSTSSPDAAPTGNKGQSDVWLVKLTSDGQVLWSKTYGGSGIDKGYSATRTQDGSYLIAATTNSSDGDITGALGNYNGWLLKISGDGDLEWQKIVGSEDNDIMFGAVYNEEDDFTVGGVQRPPSPGLLGKGFVTNLGNTSHLKGTITAPPGFSGALITASKTGFSRSTTPINGIYSMNLEPGNYALALEFQNSYYTATPVSASVNFPGFFDTATVDFVVQPIASQQDLSVSVFPLTIPRPGFEQQYKIIYRNIGTTTIPFGTVSFAPDNRFDFISAIPAPASQAGNILTWDYTSFAPFDSASINVKMKIKAPPDVNNGDTLSSYAIISPVSGDVTPSDDTAIIRQQVVGSYDPNDKTGSWGGFMPVQKVAGSPYIDYVIRFQNTGTDTAFAVHVRDTLDSRLDWSSLQMLEASHKYQLTITNKNKLDWRFAGINLVDSNRNEPASHGYVAYRVKTKNNVPVGDTIHNMASIYFDYNLPVMTNNAFTRIVNTNISLPLTLLDFRAGYQNPDAVLFWQTADEYNFDRFEIERSTDANRFEKAGTVPFRQSSGGFYQFKEDLSTKTGEVFYYRLKMIDEDGTFRYSHTQLVRKGDQGNMEIIVSPNPVYNGSGRVYINLAVASEVQLSIVDMQGRLLHQQLRSLEKGFNSLQYDMSLFPAGSYILQMKAGRETRTTRFLLVR